MTTKPNREVRHIRDFKDMLEQSTKLYGDNEAFYIKSDDGTYKGIKYREFKKEVDSFGTALVDLGLKGKFVAVIGENRYEWCLTYLAVANGVGIIVPLDRELPREEIENLLIRSHASAVVFSGKHEKDMRIISQTDPQVEYFINMDADDDDGRFLSMKKLMQKGAELLDSGVRTYIDAEIDPEAFGILIFTSGTTDLAKGVMLSHKNIVSNIMSVCSVLYIDDTDSTLIMLPLHHTYACTTSFLLMLYNGCRISFIEGLKHIAKNMKETSPSIVMAVPLLLESMYKKIWDSINKQKSAYKVKVALGISKLLLLFGIDVRKKLFRQIHENMGGRLRLIISGAAALDPAVSKGFRNFGIPVMQGYGLTECSPIVTVNQLERFRDDSIGLPLPCNEVMIYKPNREGIGEIIVKGSNVMLGYFENSLATEKALRNGWFHTGDLGRMTREGFFSITGRKKNVIVTKNGKNIYPEEVEAYLNKSPFIAESMVYGKEDEASEETFVYAMIVPAMDMIRERLGKTEVAEDEVFRIIDAEVRNVNKKMPLYKRILRFTIRQEEFAKTSTRKIKRYMEKIS
ncbi:MAG: AMP-binding protein [Clostridiaceae bacterium]|jgi:long-chain acyl-CoA synthetase|nr:AMP-binding protein [Clostridiaceae bacterium]